MRKSRTTLMEKTLVEARLCNVPWLLSNDHSSLHNLSFQAERETENFVLSYYKKKLGRISFSFFVKY